MAVQIQRPPGPFAGVNNPGDTLYVIGSENVDGSIRLQAVTANGGLVGYH